MSLRHILLGLLARPASGYDLKREFNQSLAHFWAAELAQIYPTLRGMVEENLLDVRLEPSDRGPERKVYRRTTAGERALREWLADGPALKKERIGFLAQVFFLHELESPAEVREFMLELRDHIAARLASLREIETHWSEADPRYPDALPDSEFYPQLTLRMGLLKLAAALEWCDESLARIEKRHRSGAGGKSSSVS